jgi:dTDP-4-amino-4,6-dideoxygalactose transaminase
MKLDNAVSAALGAAASSRDVEVVGGSTAAAPIRVLVADLPHADELLPSLRRLDERRWYTNAGPLVHDFEASVASLIGPRDSPPHCVTISSGTAALELALACLHLPRGTRVLVPAYTFPATANAVIRTGHVPVLADVCADRWTLTPELARVQIDRDGCGAVIPVAAFGCPMPVAQWDALADATGLPVLIDAAAALGTVQAGDRVVVAYSLHATKPLGIGEGGVVATRDEALATQLRRSINHGFESGRVASPGTNARLSEYAAAVGLAQIARWPALLARRRAIWQRYRDALGGVPSLSLQQGFGDHPPAVLTVTTDCDASTVEAALRAEGIETRRWYYPPLHEHPAYAALPRASAVGGTALRNVASLARHAIGLPFHTHLADQDIDRVAGALHALLDSPRRNKVPSSGRRVRADAPLGSRSPTT